MGGMTEFMQAMSNPQAYIIQSFAKQMITENPSVWQQCQAMFSGKSHKDQVIALRKLYKSKGMDLDNIAKQYGVQL